MFMWRTVPASGSPDIGMPVPAVIAADPYIARSRRNPALFNDLSWRVYSNHNLFAIGTSKPKRCYKQGIRNYSAHQYSPHCDGRPKFRPCFGTSVSEAIKVFTALTFLNDQHSAASPSKEAAVRDQVTGELELSGLTEVLSV
jgi:hypothetical protein